MKSILSTLILFGLLVGNTSADVIFSENFSDNTAGDIANYAGGPHVVNVADQILSLSRTATNGHVYMGATFDEAITLSVGDILTYDFRVRLTGDQGNRANEFNVGIGNSNGTPPTTNANRADDFGYVATLGAGTQSGNLYRDAGTSDWLGRQPTDGTALGALSGYNLPNGTDNLFIDYRMQIERTATGLAFSMTRDGGSLIELSDNAVPNANFYTFDMIAFGYYNRGTTNFLDVDSISVTYTAIPEPGTLLLVGIALGSLLLFRRRR